MKLKFLNDLFTCKFLIFVLLAFSLSLTILLAAIGIMNGFTDSLKKIVRVDDGDFVITHRDGFFTDDSLFLAQGALPLIQVDGFVERRNGKGVIIRGVDDKKRDRVTLGLSLAQALQVKQGDTIKVTFWGETFTVNSLEVQIDEIVAGHSFLSSHRLLVLNREQLAEKLGKKGQINRIIWYGGEAPSLLYPWIVTPSDREYQFLFSAVEVEKNIIIFILQIILLISVFNIVAFIVFLKERFIKEIFLLQLLGLSKRRIIKGALAIIALVALFSFLGALLMLKGVDLFLHSSLLRLPVKIYHIENLTILLHAQDYLFTLVLAFAWPLLLTYYIFYKFKKESIVQLMREEFTL